MIPFSSDRCFCNQTLTRRPLHFLGAPMKHTRRCSRRHKCLETVRSTPPRNSSTPPALTKAADADTEADISSQKSMTAKIIRR